VVKSSYEARRKALRKSDAHAALACMRKVPLFRGWPRSRLERLCAQLERRRYPAGARVFRQGHPGPSHVYFLAEGAARIIREFEVITTNRWPVGVKVWKEKQCKTFEPHIILEMKGPGHFFGERAIIHNGPRECTVETVTECTMYLLGRRDFVKWLMQGKALKKALQKHNYPSDSQLKSQFQKKMMREKQSNNISKMINQGSLKNYTPESGLVWLQKHDIDLYTRNTQTMAKTTADQHEKQNNSQSKDDGKNIPSKRDVEARYDDENSIISTTTSRKDSIPTINDGEDNHGKNNGGGSGRGRRPSESINILAKSIEVGNLMFDCG